jgi:hypothetical protein
MSECKHGLKHGCAYCHAGTVPVARRTAVRAGQAGQKRRTGASRLSEQMNERVTRLKQRLRELRGE